MKLNKVGTFVLDTKKKTKRQEKAEYLKKQSTMYVVNRKSSNSNAKDIDEFSNSANNLDKAPESFWQR